MNTEAIEPYIARIQQSFPEIEIQTVVPITRGWDSFVLEVNDELIFRFALREDVEVRFQKEIQLLPALETALTTPIPHFDYIGHGDGKYSHTFVGYKRIEGTMLEDRDISEEQLAALAPAIGNFLSELHHFSTQKAAQAGVEQYAALQWRDMYQERFKDIQKRVFPILDADLCRSSEQLWEGFLTTEANFSFQSVFIHGDLGCEHIFCDPQHGSLTGVIDWGDSRIGDPALDFVGLHWGHGRTFTESVLEHYTGTIDAGFWQRMAFYVCYGPFSELLYGAYTGKEEFLERGKAGLHALFGLI